MVRQHEEFVWLHDRYEENEDYAGIVVSVYLRIIPHLPIHAVWIHYIFKTLILPFL